jgi:serine/threonine protein kinase
MPNKELNKAISGDDSNIYIFDEFVLYEGTEELTAQGRSVKLARIDYFLLLHFVKNPKIVLSLDDISKKVFGLAGETLETTIRTHIASLRERLRQSPDRQLIKYISKRGYRFDADVIVKTNAESNLLSEEPVKLYKEKPAAFDEKILLISRQIQESPSIRKYEHLLTYDDFRRTGDTLNDKYKLEGFIGAGGMGLVYLAKDQSNDFVAIKLLKPEVVNRNPDNIRLFRNEFQAASKLIHPNIVRIFDSGTDEAQRISYMVMEVLDGKTIEEFLNKQRMPLEMVKDVFRQVCDAVQYAHSKNVLHLDIKPANILLVKNDNENFSVKVIDFGMSKVISSESGITVTRFGGTLQYCSPEHFGGKHTYRSDIYSLGATLYHMLVGVIPFGGGSFVIAKQHPNMEMPPIPSILNQNPDLPKGLDSVIQKALSKNPFERQESVKQLLDEFEQAFSKSDTRPLDILSNSIVGNVIFTKPLRTEEMIPNFVLRLSKRVDIFFTTDDSETEAINALKALESLPGPNVEKIESKPDNKGWHLEIFYKNPVGQVYCNLLARLFTDSKIRFSEIVLVINS